MYQFVNSYSCAISNDRKNVILHLRQSGPVFNEKGVIVNEISEPITTVLLDAEIAAALGQALVDLSGNPEQEEEQGSAQPD